MSLFRRRSSPRAAPGDLPGVLLFVMRAAIDTQQQYDGSGEPADLELAIATWGRLRGLVKREPRVSADVLGRDLIARSLNDLGLDLLDAARADDGTERFRMAAEVLREASEWAEPGSEWRSRALTNASHVLIACWKRSRAPADIDAALAAAEGGAADPPPTVRATAMNILGNALRMRARGDDLRHAVAAYGEAVNLTGPGTPDAARFLLNLGLAHRALGRAAGDAGSLDAAIASFRRALAEVRDERDLMPALEYLQESLGERGTPDDLKAQAEVLEVIAREHADVPVLAATDLALRARVLLALADVTGDRDALDAAVGGARRARELGTADPETYAIACETLADTLSTRGDALESRADLDEAITLRREMIAGDEPGA
jgi:tetratricopeptide (TPR) repeat protein